MDMNREAIWTCCNWNLEAVAGVTEGPKVAAVWVQEDGVHLVSLGRFIDCIQTDLYDFLFFSEHIGSRL